MKREIKFRGKSLDGEWQYGHYWDKRKYAYDVSGRPIAETDHVATIDGIEVQPDTVGQFTGLRDKNGNEIYEGDIVTGLHHHDFYAGLEGAVIASVIWEESYGAFMFDADCNYFADMRKCKDVEVVDNIHDNILIKH